MKQTKQEMKTLDEGFIERRSFEKKRIKLQGKRIFRKHYQSLRRYMTNEEIQSHPSLLEVSISTIDANVQYLSGREIEDFALFGTKPSTKRKKIAWLLRKVFDYQNSSDKKQTIHEAYSFISKHPTYLRYAIPVMEKNKDQIRKSLEEYRSLKYQMRPLTKDNGEGMQKMELEERVNQLKEEIELMRKCYRKGFRSEEHTSELQSH